MEFWMPLLAYFVVVGSVLLGMLFVAEAQLEPPTSLSISTNFHGLPAPWKADASVPILTVRDAPAPEIPKATVVQSTAEATATLPKAGKLADGRRAKKGRKIVRHNANRNLYAHSAAVQRQSYGVVW